MSVDYTCCLHLAYNDILNKVIHKYLSVLHCLVQSHSISYTSLHSDRVCFTLIAYACIHSTRFYVTRMATRVLVLSIVLYNLGETTCASTN
jgi:hypothetical protein